MVLQSSEMCAGLYERSVMKPSHAMETLAVLYREYGNMWLLEVRGLFEELRIVLQLEQCIGSRTVLEQVYHLDPVIVRLICYSLSDVNDGRLSACMQIYVSVCRLRSTCWIVRDHLWSHRDHASHSASGLPMAYTDVHVPLFIFTTTLGHTKVPLLDYLWDGFASAQLGYIASLIRVLVT